MKTQRNHLKNKRNHTKAHYFYLLRTCNSQHIIFIPSQKKNVHEEVRIKQAAKDKQKMC